jgi:hypothetical protein
MILYIIISAINLNISYADDAENNLNLETEQVTELK